MDKKKEKKNKDSIEPIGIECDQISVALSQSGVMKFSTPVRLNNVSLVDRITGEIITDLPFKNDIVNEHNKTVDLHEYIDIYDVVLDFEITQDPGAITVSGITQPCSRRIVIGQK